MFDFANTFLQKFNRTNRRQFLLLLLLSSVQTSLCRKQQCSSHCFRLKLKVKTFCLCFLLNTTYLHPEQVIKVFFQPFTAVVTARLPLPKLPAVSCLHPLLPLSSWLQNIKRKTSKLRKKILTEPYSVPICWGREDLTNKRSTKCQVRGKKKLHKTFSIEGTF